MTVDALLRELALVATDAAGVLEPSVMTGIGESVTAVAHLVFGAAACSIAVLDEDTDELVYTASTGVGAREIVGTRLRLGHGIGGWVAQSGQAVAVSDLRADPRFAREVAEATSYIPTALMAVPIEDGDRVVGVLTVLDRDATRPGAERDLELATAFAAQAAAGIRATEAFREIGAGLLAALTRAAAEGSSLRSALAQLPPWRPAEPAGYITLLAALRAADPAEQQLALRVIEDVVDYASRKGGSSRPR